MSRINAVRDVLSLATLDAAVEACRPETRGVKRGCDLLCIEYIHTYIHTPVEEGVWVLQAPGFEESTTRKILCVL